MSRRSLALRLCAKEDRRERRALRIELVAAQRNHCGICGKRIYADFQGNGSKKSRGYIATLDHVWPLSVRQQWAGNLVAAHLRCNARKDCRLPTGCELIWLAAANAGLG